MADLNALIAQGYQFQPPPDPFVQYGRMQQLEQGQQTNQLNRMKMQEAQRAMEETNALRRLDPASATYLQDVTRLNPKLGFEFAKSQREAKTADTEGQIKSTKLVADKLALLPDAYRMADTPEAYLAVHKSVHADPVLGPYLQSLGATPEKGLAQLDEAVQTGKFDQFRMKSMQSVSQLLDSMKPVAVSASSSIYDPSKGTFSQAPAAPEKAPTSTDATTMQALGYPLTPEGFEAFKNAQRQDRLLTPEEEAQKTRIALASRPPGAPRPEPAPSITNIVDPTNPNQMIAIDTRRYQGGGVGSLGVIGASGKEPGAAVRTNKTEAGKTQLADDLENLRASFETLDRLRAIPSTERGALSNVTSGLASTAIGQRTGQFFATEAQVERDVINSARSRLVNSIKNATGMSAQQLNSNVELQTMLKSISDPGQSYQSALRIIEDIENAYVKGSGMTPKPGKPAAPKPSGGAPPPPAGFKPD